MRFRRAIPQGYLMLAVLLALAPESCPKEEKADPKPWANKDWTQWTELESTNVLLRSPWSDYHADYNTDYSYSYWNPDRTPVSIFHAAINVQWLTALPIRQAHLRRTQAESNYRQMDNAARAEFDRLAAEELAASPGMIVVRVAYVQSSRYPTRSGRVPYEIVLLLSDGRIVLPSETVHKPVREDLLWGMRVNRMEMDVTFPRILEGDQVIKAGDSTVTVVVGWRYGVNFRPARQFDFNLANMIYNGKLEY